jgi:hypothetical protein
MRLTWNHFFDLSRSLATLVAIENEMWSGLCNPLSPLQSDRQVTESNGVGRTYVVFIPFDSSNSVVLSGVVVVVVVVVQLAPLRYGLDFCFVSSLLFILFLCL